MKAVTLFSLALRFLLFPTAALALPDPSGKDAFQTVEQVPLGLPINTNEVIGKTWNLARLAQSEKLVPGSAGQGTSSTTEDWSVRLEEGLGKNVIIYVIDGGVNPKHPLLEPRVKDYMNPNGSGPNSDQEESKSGHGTKVACAAAGKDYGVASSATIVRIKVWKGEDQGSMQEIANAVRTAINDFDTRKKTIPKLQAVINISKDTSDLPGTDIRNALVQAITEGIHVVLSAGNDGDNKNRWGKAIPGVIYVGGININDHLVSSSNYGELVDIYAGGQDIITCGPQGELRSIERGTSFAAPQVAGIIAGLLSQQIEKDNVMTPEDMKGFLRFISVKGKITAPEGKTIPEDNNRIAQFPPSLLY